MPRYSHNEKDLESEKDAKVSNDQIEYICESSLRDDNTINFKISLFGEKKGRRRALPTTICVNSSNLHSSLLRSNKFVAFYKDLNKKHDSFDKYLKGLKNGESTLRDSEQDDDMD